MKTWKFSRWDVGFPAYGLLVVLGGTCALLSVSVDYSFGNLNTYVISYLRQNDSSIGYDDWIFISQAKVIFGGIFGPFSGPVARKLGPKKCLLLGSLIYSGGFMMMYFTLDVGLWSCAFVMGVMYGIGYGLIYPIAAATPLKWFPVKLRGFFGSFTIAGYGYGSVIWNPLETAFVNPDNISPVTIGDEDDLYFNDKEVLDKIPKLFLLLGGCFLALQLVALILVRDPTNKEAKIIKTLDPNEAKDEEILEHRYQVKSKDVIKIWDYWKLYISFLVLTMLNNFVANYQKAYGQRYIQGDSYFALVATVQNVINGTSRIVWGFIYDRKGFQFSVFIISCVSTMIAFSFGDLAFFEFDSLGARIFYATWVWTLFAFLPGSYSCYPAVLNAAYGQVHCASNYGIIFTAQIIYGLILTVSTTFFFDFLGYIGMFFMAGLFGIIGMIVVYLFPNKISINHSEQYRERFEKMEIKQDGDL